MSMGYNVKVSNIIEQQSTLGQGNTLYVGGSGEGNYTRIQDGVDNASDGDTVFVYAYSSPYYENVVVNKSINLIGEDEDTTIIDGYENGNVVYVTADGVTISGFTIMNGVGGYIRVGISVNANYTIISNNIIKNNYWGIGVWNNNEGPIYTLTNNVISDNKIISNSDEAISLHFCKLSTITNNIISNNAHDGIQMRYSYNNIISGNEISNNDNGMDLYQDCYSNDISKNNITNNRRYGISLLEVGDNNIFQNNFIGNRWRNVKLHYYIKDIKKNNWYENYWNKPRTFPYLIFGGLSLYEGGLFGIIPWINIDWNPAQEPYDI